MTTNPSPNSTLLSLVELANWLHHFNKRAEKLWGLSLTQWALLSHLIDNPGCSPQNLASLVGVHPSTLTQTMKRLHKKGLLFVAEDPKDSRKKIISITRAGRDKLYFANSLIQKEPHLKVPLQSSLSQLKKF